MFPADWNALMTSLLPYKQETNCCIQTSCWGWVGGVTGWGQGHGQWGSPQFSNAWSEQFSPPEPVVWGWADGSQGSHGSGSLDKTIATGQAWGPPQSTARVRRVRLKSWQCPLCPLCCSRVLCWMHPANSRNLVNSMVPIQRSCGHRNLVPWKKCFRHQTTEIPTYILCKLTVMTKYMIVRMHFLLLTL